MRYSSSEAGSLKPLLAGGIVFALVGLLMDMRGTITPVSASRQDEVCQGEVEQEVTLSREQVAQLLTVPERDSKETVRTILKEPYCQLPSLQVRAGVEAEREAYPLAFEPKTWLIVLYEGEEYAGFQFRLP